MASIPSKQILGQRQKQKETQEKGVKYVES